MLRSILPLLFLAAHFATQARATHGTCTWQLPQKPWDAGYIPWCYAYISTDLAYKCEPSSASGHAGQVVADWSKLRESVLEFHTPCGGGGYAKAHGCPTADWAVCVGSGKLAECRGLKAKDDCELDVGKDNMQWRVVLNHVIISCPCLPPGEWFNTYPYAPREVQIWYNYYGRV